MALQFNGKNITLWKIEKRETSGKKNYIIAQFTTQTKNKITGQWETDCSGNMSFFGNAYEKFIENGLQEKTRINVLSGTHSNIYNKEKKTSYQNYTVWEFEIASISEGKKEQSKQVKMQSIDDLNTELPF